MLLLWILYKSSEPFCICYSKILINDKRGNKKEKDVIAIKNFLEFITITNKYKEEFKELYNKLPKKWKNKVLSFAKNENIFLPLND